MKNTRTIKAARELAGWSQSDLAKASGVSLPTVQRIEHPDFGPERASAANVEKIAAAFEAAGVTFHTGRNGDCVCVRAP